MPKPKRSLTAAAVARIPPPEQGQVDHFDRIYPGLALRVSYRGTKTWVCFYRLHDKQKRLSLGRYPAMSLNEAHEAYRAVRLAVSKGENPAHIKPTKADTFAATAEEWLKRDQAKNRSANEVRRAIEHDVISAWGDRLVAAITRRDVHELIDGVADRGALIMARRLHSHLHRLFRWAVGRGIIENNPMADLPKLGAAVKRDRVLTGGELKAVWKAAETTAWPFGPAIKLLVLTAARREEIGALRWSEVHGDEIQIPSERSKSGEARIIPLSPAALALIQDLPRVGEHVFSANGSGLGGWSKAKRAIDTAAAKTNGEPLAPWRLHDLRRTTATNLQRLGVGLQVIESILGHVGGSRAGIVGVYQRHQYLAEQKAALEAWAREIERIVSDKHVEVRLESVVAVGVASPFSVEIKPIDPEWAAAIELADETNSPEPLLAYLNRPGPQQLGPDECFLLKLLFERIKRFTRKKPGNYVPLRRKSRRETYQFGAAYVHEVRRREGLSQQDAIDRACQVFPELSGDGDDQRLLNFMKRGS
jgi:integrase